MPIQHHGNGQNAPRLLGVSRSRRRRPQLGNTQTLGCNLNCRHAARSANQRGAASSHVCDVLGIPPGVRFSGGWYYSHGNSGTSCEVSITSPIFDVVVACGRALHGEFLDHKRAGIQTVRNRRVPFQSSDRRHADATMQSRLDARSLKRIQDGCFETASFNARIRQHAFSYRLRALYSAWYEELEGSPVRCGAVATGAAMVFGVGALPHFRCTTRHAPEPNP